MKVDGVKGLPESVPETDLMEREQGRIKPIGHEVALGRRENGFSSKGPKAQEALEPGELERLKKDILRLQELLKERIQEFLERHDLVLRYLIDEDTRSVVTQLVRRKSGEVVRQIPSEESLRLKERIEEFLQTVEGDKR